MSKRAVISGTRDVRGVVDSPDGDRIVVACPPHPQMGGSRSDSRLTAVGDALAEKDIACLRFDYGPWDEGRGEVTDAVNAMQWARERYDRVGLFGYSFGGGVALLAAVEAEPDALSVLAPAATFGDQNAAAAIEDIHCPLQVCYGERDDTADWQAIVEAARQTDAEIEQLPSDHFFVGQRGRVGQTVATFLSDRL